MSAYLITGGENPRLELKCDTVLEYEYGPFSRYQDLKQEYTFQLDEPGDVLAPGVSEPGSGLPDVASGGSAYRLPALAALQKAAGRCSANGNTWL